MKKIFFCCLLLASSFASIAQADSDKSSIASFLDDGGRTKSKNLLKTDLAQIYQGDLPIIWEHLFNRQFSIEVGVGLVTNYRDELLGGLMDNGENTLTDPNVGYSLYVAPRLYTTWAAGMLSVYPGQYPGGFESIYFTVPLRLRQYPKQIRLFDVSTMMGKQWIFNNRLLVDIAIGVGLVFQKSLDDKTYVFDAESRIPYEGKGIILPDEYPNKMRISIPVSLKVGYRF